MTQTAAPERGMTDNTVRKAKESFAKLRIENVQRFVEQFIDPRLSPKVTQLKHPTDGAGASNGIAFVTVTLMDGGSPRDEEIVIRYTAGVPLLKQKSPATEYALLRVLDETSLPTPTPLWLDEDGATLGFPGFAMKRVEGTPPAAAMYSAGPLANMSDEDRHATMLKAAAFHGDLRRAAIGADRLPFLLSRGVGRLAGETAIERELNWWLDEVALVTDDDDPRRLEIEALRDWLVRHQPRDVYEPILVHGDSQIANIIFDKGEIAAVIDWELSYLGHVETDVYGIVFLTETMKQLDRDIGGTPTEAEYIQAFEEAAGTPAEHWDYFRLMYMFKVVAVTRLGVAQGPQYDGLWTFYAAQLAEEWNRARAIYGD